jgi:hypothetical protein
VIRKDRELLVELARVNTDVVPRVHMPTDEGLKPDASYAVGPAGELPSTSASSRFFEEVTVSRVVAFFRPVFASLKSTCRQIW